MGSGYLIVLFYLLNTSQLHTLSPFYPWESGSLGLLQLFPAGYVACGLIPHPGLTAAQPRGGGGGGAHTRRGACAGGVHAGRGAQRGPWGWGRGAHGLQASAVLSPSLQPWASFSNASPYFNLPGLRAPAAHSSGPLGTLH